jgi:methionyl-tRNA formyltransferase
MKLVFFGGSEFSVYVLDELKIHGILPELVITTPDKPKGRKLVLTPTPVKVWAQKNNIEVIDPASLKKDNASLISKLQALNSELFLVASYGKIIPKEIFEIPEHKTLNIHPSLLPKYRGASPIQAQILGDEKEIGVTIMQIDEGMDTGPLLLQRKFPISNFQFPMPGRKELERVLAIEGTRLFAHILPEWLVGAIDPIMQDESRATLCQKIEKEDGELVVDLDDLSKNARQNLLKIKAFEEWPTAYFFTERGGKKIRIIITDATLEGEKLKILKVIPEGKKEMPFEDFKRGLR